MAIFKVTGEVSDIRHSQIESKGNVLDIYTYIIEEKYFTKDNVEAKNVFVFDAFKYFNVLPTYKVEVTFTIKCNEYNGRFFTSLNAFGIDVVSIPQQLMSEFTKPKPNVGIDTDFTREQDLYNSGSDNLPF